MLFVERHEYDDARSDDEEDRFECEWRGADEQKAEQQPEHGDAYELKNQAFLHAVDRFAGRIHVESGLR